MNYGYFYDLHVTMLFFFLCSEMLQAGCQWCYEKQVAVKVLAQYFLKKTYFFDATEQNIIDLYVQEY